MRENRILRISLLCLATLALATAAQANLITSVTGACFDAGLEPANLTLNAYTNNTQIIVFTELQDLTLATPLTVRNAHLGTNIILPVDTVVSSYLLHLDSVSNTTINLAGSVTFSQPILGIIYENAPLGTSDSILGLPTTTFYTGTSRGLESADSTSISTYTLTINDWRVTTAIDEIRVIVAPEPATLTILALGTLALIRRKR